MTELSDEELLELLTLTVEVNEYGIRMWRNKDGQFHRKFGPAIELSTGYNSYWYEGKLHRTDGPAITYATGDKEFWINGERVDPF